MRGEKSERPASRADIEERFLRDWGFELPDSIFRFWDFLSSLAPAGHQALRDLDVSPVGVIDLFADTSLQPRQGIDVRVHGRYYRDPPEFLTFMHGGSDGLHHGLWFDDGRTCRGVASYYTHDGGGIDTTSRTPLEALRAILERCWRDLDDDVEDEDVSARRSRLALLRDALTVVETGDRPEVGLAYSRAYDTIAPAADFDRITTLDGAGALVAGETALDRPAHGQADEYKFATYIYALFEDPAALQAGVEEARRRCSAGDPAEALVLGRDLHWASGGDPAREALANELLVMAYRVLNRPSLAEIAGAHHRHRSLPRVDVLEQT
ncbi:ADP-ribosylation family protein [Streptomyces sp. NBC_00286]|uniref:ADP-ribosylation family protein n=1 Tax=Streptomyces sp. NBC_00286 TaxID=2975701 RepID=UPI002E2D893A|nr:ADP-ribosylation family protein [Streptomyces sp. NBC_00286]